MYIAIKTFKLRLFHRVFYIQLNLHDIEKKNIYYSSILFNMMNSICSKPFKFASNTNKNNIKKKILIVQNRRKSKKVFFNKGLINFFLIYAELAFI